MTRFDPETLVIDSSVAVKWFKPDAEKLVAEALDLLREHRDGLVLLAAPVHLKLEVLNALWSHRLGESQLRQAAADLDDFSLMWFEADSELLDSAASIAAAHRLTVYDALFAALTLRLDAELVTVDQVIVRSGACRVRALDG